MSRYIDADVLCNVLKKSAADEWNKRALAGTWSYAYQDMIDTIENEPSADVEPVRHGRWIRICGDDYECSECQAAVWSRPPYPIERYKYCWSCGAKMDKEEEKK